MKLSQVRGCRTGAESSLKEDGFRDQYNELLALRESLISAAGRSLSMRARQCSKPALLIFFRGLLRKLCVYLEFANGNGPIGSVGSFPGMLPGRKEADFDLFVWILRIDRYSGLTVFEIP